MTSAHIHRGRLRHFLRYAYPATAVYLVVMTTAIVVLLIRGH